MANPIKDRRKLLNLTVKEFIDDYIYRIDLDADYQREKIWSVKQQEELLDSILIDIDIPKIYLTEITDNKQFDYECIDGKQRMSTLLKFFKPDADEKDPLFLRFLEEKFTYERLKEEHPTVSKRIEDFELNFSIYTKIDNELIREIFRRLQLGIRLNSGELLKSRTGTIRDFIYKEIGNSGPFFRNTNLSEKRFSRPFTLAQICFNSFAKNKTGGDFVRARLQDIEDFFEEYHDLDTKDSNLLRIKDVLNKMDKAFGQGAKIISSRAVAVTCYLFIEDLHKNDKNDFIPKFAHFFVNLLLAIKFNMERLSNYELPTNPVIMEEFQKYILQASVEAYSIKRRHHFLQKAFDYYLNEDTKGKIIGIK